MCNCKKKQPAAQTKYKYTSADGKTTKEFTSELRAKMEVRSKGGKFEPA
jgi:hypothetical protein